MLQYNVGTVNLWRFHKIFSNISDLFHKEMFENVLLTFPILLISFSRNEISHYSFLNIQITVWKVGYFYNGDVVLGRVKFENSLKPSKTERVPILSPVSDIKAILHFCEENRGKIVKCTISLMTYLWGSGLDYWKAEHKFSRYSTSPIQRFQRFPLSSSKVSICIIQIFQYFI